jgi:O-antigen/teichoic acid export membrane protein
MLARLVAHSSHYALGSILVTLASLFSFPLLTRILSVDEYGTLSLIAAILLLFTGLGKLGMQHSIVRFQAEVRAGKRDVDEAGYLTTVILGLGFTGLIGSIVMVIAGFVVPESWWNNPQVAALLLPVSAFVLMRALDSAVLNLLRAQQRSVAYNVYSVVKKYFALIAALGVMFFFVPRLKGFYLGTFLAEALITLIGIVYLWRLHHASIKGFSSPTFKAMLAFGIPMIAFEISGIILNLGDRYVIQALMGAAAVGEYSAAYNLCEYLQTMLMASIAQAVSPIYLRMWEEKGAAETREFIERALRFYVLVGAAVLAGVSAVGADTLVLLASEKYRAGAVVIPYVVAGMLISGAIPFFAAGIYVHKQNHMMIPFVILSAVINIGLNIWLVPKLGLTAAGIATLVSFTFLSFCCWRLGVRGFDVPLPVMATIKFGLLALLMYLLIMQISGGNVLITMLMKIAAGGAFYITAVIVFDREVRAFLVEKILPRIGKFLKPARAVNEK